MVRGKFPDCSSFKKTMHQSNYVTSVRRIALSASTVLLLVGCSSVEKVADNITGRFNKSPAQTEQSLVSAGGQEEPVKSAREVLVSDIQSGLDELGYGPGRTDGQMDSQTEAAIQDFQLDNNLRITGRISKGLLESIQSEVAQ